MSSAADHGLEPLPKLFQGPGVNDGIDCCVQDVQRRAGEENSFREQSGVEINIIDDNVWAGQGEKSEEDVEHVFCTLHRLQGHLLGAVAEMLADGHGTLPHVQVDSGVECRYGENYSPVHGQDDIFEKQYTCRVFMR